MADAERNRRNECERRSGRFRCNHFALERNDQGQRATFTTTPLFVSRDAATYMTCGLSATPAMPAFAPIHLQMHGWVRALLAKKREESRDENTQQEPRIYMHT
jgi:hypothetical protein